MGVSSKVQQPPGVNGLPPPQPAPLASPIPCTVKVVALVAAAAPLQPPPPQSALQDSEQQPHPTHPRNQGCSTSGSSPPSQPRLIINATHLAEAPRNSPAQSGS